MKMGMMAAIALMMVTGVAWAEDKNPLIKVESLMRSDAAWDGVPYASYPNGKPELSILKITIPAHSHMKWHTHPMPNAAYILSGELTVEEKSGQKIHLVAGQAFPETVGSVHRGVTGDSPVVLIVFYAGTKGMPLSQAAIDAKP